jgi:hypothetical protein
MRLGTNLKVTLLISALLCLLATSLYGQQPKPRWVEGRIVLAQDSMSGIAFAHVYNKSTEKGTTSDVDGRFRIQSKPGDSLEFRMIGYVDTTMSFSQAKAIRFIIPLKERVYQLRQVDVRANRFKTPFAPAEPSKDPYVGYRSVKPSGRSRQKQEISAGPAEGMGVAVTGALTALANKFNKNEQQRERIRQLKEQDEIKKYYKALFEYWFDKEFVAEITGLSGTELNRFIKFCKPSLTFLEEATEYEVITAIQKYHRQYQNINRY